ncbi:hypothetical protein [Bradyrhizobium sp. BWA-3-5]|uniref:hypothetical protein n=1 Tax=Bradyrhizobium sp. BWA-3-5 TaxID=3080013 RepID=UPI00293E81DB|nr:hypothetical protein [Bradyrhizobium sp. BWA-3-5]WOH70088.1 hypothetical protein RX331_37165 [Bradyrhizobium sp. BWA-3-5]
MTTPVIIVVIVVIPVTHPLVVLTVSHVSPSIPALKLFRCLAMNRCGAREGAPNHDAVRIHVIDVANHRVQQRRVPQPAANQPRAGPNRSACQNQPNRLA